MLGCRLEKQKRDLTKIDSRIVDVGSKNRQENQLKQTLEDMVQALKNRQETQLKKIRKARMFLLEA